MKKGIKSLESTGNGPRQYIWDWIIFFSVIGFFVSIYLIQGHFSGTTSGSVCDISETVSCSIVNSSKYSELFNAPVSVLGMLWFLVLILMGLFAKRKEGALHVGMFLWSIIGFFFVVYMIIAEIILGAICPFCTIIHVIVIVCLILSYLNYTSGEKVSNSYVLNEALPWILFIVILFLIPIIYFNVTSSVDHNYDMQAQCITEKGVVMYGSFLCSVCAKTRAAFGDSFEYIKEVECHPRGENPKTELCLERDIASTPTWILEPNGVEVKRLVGFASVDELVAFAGCE